MKSLVNLVGMSHRPNGDAGDHHLIALDELGCVLEVGGDRVVVAASEDQEADNDERDDDGRHRDDPPEAGPFQSAPFPDILTRTGPRA